MNRGFLMYNGKKIVALIPLRGGSKFIPKKNIKIIANKPLCAWVLESALTVPSVDEVYVSTEDYEIMNIVKKIDPRIKIIKRPEKFATDDASTESVMLHFSKNVSFDVLITIQATSPLTSANDISNGIEKFFTEKLDSLVTGVKVKRFFWDNKGKAVNYDYKNRPRRQEFEGWIMENGAFYITSRTILENNKCRLGGKIGILEMSEETGIEIDTLNDWDFVEYLLTKRVERGFIQDFKAIKLLAVDVDKALTDGWMYYSSNGEFLKKFNIRDAKGLELNHQEGIQVVIITPEDSDVVKARMNKLNIEKLSISLRIDTSSVTVKVFLSITTRETKTTSIRMIKGNLNCL